MSNKHKLLILGYGRHGKDTVCEILRDDHGYTFQSSSLFCAKNVVRPYLEHRGIIYETIEQCYADRHNHRAHWFQAIADYNSEDLTRLSQEIMAKYDIYCGMRNIEELNACKAHPRKIFDAIIWVDASDRLPPENADSCSITKEDADYVLDNNGPLENLKKEVGIMLRGLDIRRDHAG